MYEIFEQLLQKFNITPYKISKDTGVTQTTLSNWKNGKSTPSTANMQKIADYFNVSIDYLMTGQESTDNKRSEFNARDERDIKNTLDSLMGTLDSKDGAPLFYDGQEMSPETRLLFETQLEGLIRTVKKINKEKYNPYKNKK